MNDFWLGAMLIYSAIILAIVIALGIAGGLKALFT
jgi:hypothetical protein